MATTSSASSPTIRRPQASIKLPSTDENIKPTNEEPIIMDPARKRHSQLHLVSDDSLSSKVAPVTPLAAYQEGERRPKNIKLHHEPAVAGPAESPNPLVDDLLRKITEQQQQGITPKPIARLSPAEGKVHTKAVYTAESSSSSSMPPTPANENFGTTAPAIRPASTNMKQGVSNTEVNRLENELHEARIKISELELAGFQMRQRQREAEDTANITEGRLPGPPILSRGPSNLPTATSIQLGTAPPSGYDDSRTQTGDMPSINDLNRTRGIWAGGKPDQVSGGGTPGSNVPGNSNYSWAGRGSNQEFMDSNMGYNAAPGSESYRAGGPSNPDYDMAMRAPNGRRNYRYEGRFGASSYDQGPYRGYPQYGQAQYDMNGPGQNGMAANSQYPMSVTSQSSHQPSAIGTPLSPLATEFTSGGGSWKSENAVVEGPTYIPTTEPLNYRRLLDRNVNCNWKYIVDKIVCNNDQQASIFLQQKLKVGTPDQKYEIVDAIILQAHPLMVNRFGNFLVQRCFEHGTPEQVIKIAEAIRGNTLSLSMDPFGCHVVQKAFDSVPEDYKAVMVHELLRRIPETVIHRYACHVWQKLFELRWSESPPQIMKYVNEALRGMWHEVALGETGSLVVQNIFENCLEEDKRPCIEEVLANIDIVAHGQFGNWCIQHICEQGAPTDKSRALDHVIRFASEYSMDQYASKVVEKCLKAEGENFIDGYLEQVCKGRVDRPRIPLIDIASDQYGNYLIQWILTHASPKHRDRVAAHIRRHMVSLRGSKFGSRVGMLCTNPAVATRPGPGISSIGRLPGSGPRFGRPYQ